MILACRDLLTLAALGLALSPFGLLGCGPPSILACPEPLPKGV
jgi:hypothetical protein